MSFVKRYNQETGKKLKAKDFIGKEISAQIVENTAEETKVADIKTKIVRIVDDSEDAEAVSYTHLDVYKRQAFGLPAEQYAMDTGNDPAEFTAENIANFKRQINALGFSYDWDREAVSYTHLDVYKRQPRLLANLGVRV